MSSDFVIINKEDVPEDLPAASAYSEPSEVREIIQEEVASAKRTPKPRKASPLKPAISTQEAKRSPGRRKASPYPRAVGNRGKIEDLLRVEEEKRKDEIPNPSV